MRVVTRVSSSCHLLKLIRCLSRCVGKPFSRGSPCLTTSSDYASKWRRNDIRIGLYKIRLSNSSRILCGGHESFQSEGNCEQPRLSFYLITKRTIFYVERKVKFSKEVDKSLKVPFYRLDALTKRLLLLISSKKIDKFVYNDGIDLFFCLYNYFGVLIYNLFDISYFYSLHSFTNNSRIETHNHHQIIAKYLFTCGKGAYFRSEQFCRNGSGIKFAHILDKRDVENLSLLHRIGSWLYKNVTNSTSLNSRFENVYSEMLTTHPRTFILKYKRQLEPSTLDYRSLKDRLFKRIVDSERPYTLVCLDSADFNGILKYRKEKDEHIIFFINSYVINQHSNTINPVYGLADGERFKHFVDKRIGDVVACSHTRKECDFEFLNNLLHVQVDRLHGDSLVYSLRKKSLVPLHN